MKNSKLYKGLYAVILCIPFMMVSCDKETETTETFSRLFMPPELTASVNGNNVTFSWTPVGDGLYSVEISRDSLLFTTNLKVFEVEGKNTFEIGDLYSQSRYSVRVKAISKNPEVGDSWYQERTFTTGTENIFYSVASGDVGINSVLLKWNNKKQVSQIVVSAEGASDVTVPLLNTEITAGEKLIENLNPGTVYTFRIFLSTDMLRGTITVTTKTL
jgi:hypothetical protein